MSTVSFVAKIKRDWRYPHRDNAYQFVDRPPPGFQATEPPDWVTGTVRGTVPGPDMRERAKNEDAPSGMIPGGAIGSLFDESADTPRGD
jgi:hypothetical protein